MRNREICWLDRQKDRHTLRQTERQMYKQRDRQTGSQAARLTDGRKKYIEIDKQKKQIGRQSEWEKGKEWQKDKLTSILADRQKDRKKYRLLQKESQVTNRDRQTNRQANGKTEDRKINILYIKDRQTDRQTGGQKGRKTTGRAGQKDRQTDLEQMRVQSRSYTKIMGFLTLNSE